MSAWQSDRDWLNPPLPPGPRLQGQFREAPEHFQVREELNWTPAGEGPHLLLWVGKRGANTAWVASRLAESAGCRPSDVGYCGAKDRHAETWQWFSVPDAKGELATRAERWQGDGWRVLECVPHQRKLRRGDHAGNRFRISASLEAPASEATLDAWRERLAQGVPNYFGQQRFGRGGNNVRSAEQWVTSGRLPRQRGERGWVLSAARALLFNRVLAARVDAGNFTELLAGDPGHEGAPTGPLWGRGRPLAVGVTAALEQAALDGCESWCERLEHVGMQQERRPLLLRPAECQLRGQGSVLELDFALPAGTFATAVLAALGDFEDIGGSPPSNAGGSKP